MKIEKSSGKKSCYTWLSSVGNTLTTCHESPLYHHGSCDHLVVAAATVVAVVVGAVVVVVVVVVH